MPDEGDDDIDAGAIGTVLFAPLAGAGRGAAGRSTLAPLSAAAIASMRPSRSGAPLSTTGAPAAAPLPRSATGVVEIVGGVSPDGLVTGVAFDAAIAGGTDGRCVAGALGVSVAAGAATTDRPVIDPCEDGCGPGRDMDAGPEAGSVRRSTERATGARTLSGDVTRASAADVARRRIEAEAYLGRHFPTSATWWTRLRDGAMSATDLAEAVTAMVTEATTVEAPALEGDRDKLTLNPEQAVVRVLQRVGQHEVAIAQYQAELSALDAVRDAISQMLAAHQNAGKSDMAELIAAAAQRPSIDREIERRSVAILRTGVTRADVIRLKQNADKLWKRPHNWAGLLATSGRFQIRELPASDGVEHELLPPDANILHYCRDAAAFRADVAQATPNAIMDRVEAELVDWITLHYPGTTARKPEVIAKAWAALIMLDHRAMQESDRRLIALLPSAWTPRRVMRIESND